MAIEQQPSNFVELPSDLVCAEPELLKQWLLSALAASHPPIVSGRLVTRAGTAALQLLVAFRRECDARTIPFELRDPSQPLLETIACAGLMGELCISTLAD